MPTTDIIGYLWGKRQVLDLSSVAEAVSLAADLIAQGVECIQVKEMTALGTVIGVSTSYPRKTKDEWDEILHEAIVTAAVAETEHMMKSWEERDE